jgi:hypothetical protein
LSGLVFKKKQKSKGVGGFGEIISFLLLTQKWKIDLDFLWLDDKRKIRVVVVYSFVS